MTGIAGENVVGVSSGSVTVPEAPFPKSVDSVSLIIIPSVLASPMRKMTRRSPTYSRAW